MYFGNCRGKTVQWTVFHRETADEAEYRCEHAPERKSMKSLFISLITLLALLMMSCTSNTIAPSTAAPLGQGKIMVLRLETNPSTGFGWQYSLLEGDDKGALELVNQNFDSNNKNENLVGAGGYDTYEFKATKKGPQELTFTYMRNWEGGEVAYDVVYELDIDDDLNIIYIGKKKGIVETEKALSSFPDPTFP